MFQKLIESKFAGLIASSTLVLGSLANAQMVSAATFTPLAGFTDADFNALKNDSTFQEDWVAEGRIGNNALNGTFEQTIINWTTNTTNNTGPINQFIWPNGTAVPFSVTYDTANGGTLAYTLNGLPTLTRTGITEFARVPTINHLFLRTRSARSDTTTTLQNLAIGSMSFAGTLTSSGANDVDYLQITDLSVPFTLTGEAILAWNPILGAPRNSASAFEVKAGYSVSVSVPEPASMLGLLAVGGLGLAMKRNKSA